MEIELELLTSEKDEIQVMQKAMEIAKKAKELGFSIKEFELEAEGEEEDDEEEDNWKERIIIKDNRLDLSIPFWGRTYDEAATTDDENRDRSDMGIET